MNRSGGSGGSCPAGGREGGGGNIGGRSADLATIRRTRHLSLGMDPEEMDNEDGDDHEAPADDTESEKGKCSRCMSCCKKVTTFLLSHVGLISLVVGYCIMGAFTFEALESSHEIQVKRNMTKVRQAVTHHLWTMTKHADVIIPEVWLENTTRRLQEFETELLRAMKKGGWDGSEKEDTQQWTFSGALFYSIVVITTIGYGHISPKTVWGKVVTIFYAILGIPLMLLCLSHIGDFLANAFRFVYWKVCCYMCTRRPRVIIRRHPAGNFRRSRSLRTPGTTKYTSSSGYSSSNSHPRALRRSASSAMRRSARTSQRSADSAYSTDSAILAITDSDFRRAHSDEDVRRAPLLKSPNVSAPSSATVGGGGEGRLGMQLPKHVSGSSGGLNTQSAAARHLQIREPIQPPPQQLIRHHQRNLQRSTRSAEPVILPGGGGGGRGGESFNLPVLCNRYAEDVPVIMDESEIRRAPPPPIRQPELFVTGDYWEDDIVEDYIVYGSDDIPKNRPVPIWLCVVLVLSYILFGAFLFSEWENWKYLDSAYFCFITLTTIGFGDFVPAQRVKSESAQVSIALCSLYLLFGISLLAMSFNLVQEEVISSVKLVATRLGIIREEDG